MSIGQDLALFLLSVAVFKSRGLWSRKVQNIVFGACAVSLVGFGAWFIFPQPIRGGEIAFLRPDLLDLIAQRTSGGGYLYYFPLLSTQ